MKVGGLYKHIHNTDVAFSPTRPADFRADKGRIMFEGRWFNIAYPDMPYFIKNDVIFVKDEDINKWIEIYL